MDLQEIKNELMCYGAFCADDAASFLHDADPYIGASKCVHSACFFLNGVIPVNIPISEKYVQRSPYIISLCNNDLSLFKENEYICCLRVMPAPKWYNKKTTNGLLMRDVLCVHGNNVLSLSYYHGCYYFDIGKKCKYCSVMPNKSIQRQPFSKRKQDFVEAVMAAVDENPQYSLALSEGTINNTDRGAVFFSSLLRAIAENGVLIHSSVELAPPNDNSYIDLLHESGADSIIMNIEFSSDETRLQYCPGKGEIPIERYFEALRYAVLCFGAGNVASVLICGLEPPKKTIDCACALIDIGVTPVLIPFKPYDNCEMVRWGTTDPALLREITSKVSGYYRQAGISSCQSGCIACGSCNSKFY